MTTLYLWDEDKGRATGAIVPTAQLDQARYLCGRLHLTILSEVSS